MDRTRHPLVDDLVKGPGHQKRARFRWPRPLVRIALETIWAPGAIPPEEIKYAYPLKRVFLPLLDVLIIIAGIYGAHSGIPSFERLMPDALSDALSLMFVVAGVIAFAGIAFPALWLFEALAKYALVGMLGTYFFALLAVGGTSQTRDFIACLVLVTLPFMLYRLWILADEWQTRRLTKKKDRARL